MTRKVTLAAVAVVAAAAAVLVVLLPEPADEPSGGLVGAAAADPCGETVRRPTGDEWLCTFADDFDGQALDPDRWRVLTTFESGGRKPECRVDDPDNVALRAGVLHLTAITEPRPVTCEAQDGHYVTRRTAGAVTTSRLFAQAYGRVEIVAAMPAYRGVGFHSALWMFPQRPHYGRWPASGEIDIVEYRTGLFGHPVPTLHWLTDGEHELHTTYRCTVARPDELHSYVLEWSPAGMRFLYDGRPCLVVVFDSLGLPGPRPFDRPFFVIMNQSHGIGHNEPDRRTPSSATMRVDSLRIWR